MNDIRKTPEYRQWRDAVKQRDGHCCRRCKFDRNLHVHHIKPLDKYPEFAVVLDNGLTLCGNCHSLLTGKEETTNLRAFFSNDPKIEKQLSVIEGSLTNYLDRKARQRRRQGWKKVHEGQDAVAIENFDKAIELNPNFAYAYYYYSRGFYVNRGDAKYHLEQYTAAIIDYDKAIELYPSYTTAHYKYNLLYPSPATVYYKRGLANKELGKYDSAISDFNTTIQLDPNHAEAHEQQRIVQQRIREVQAERIC